MKLDQITEASYKGNIGVMELMKFFQTAPEDVVTKVKDLISKGEDKEVWQIVQTHTGTKLQGDQFNEALEQTLNILQNQKL